MIEELNLKLDDIKISSVESHTILERDNTLLVNIYHHDGTTKKIEFEGYRSYFYQDNDQLNHTRYTSLNSNLDFISYYKHGFARFTSLDISNAEEINISIPNFVINLLDSTIFIDADSIRINNKKYQVNFYN